ncbi:hypothetical protein ACIP5Y_22530 [Nocardia sp. NPDC088792]|uniref:hypothetical protein n=1 Tax=Nocardia sp. NPDC088792 TaxID=3364332 RepID=UPI00380600FB
MLVTSVIGAGALFALRSGGSTDSASSSSPDDRGYHVVDKLCDTADFSVIAKTGFEPDTEDFAKPRSITSRDTAVDSASCDTTYSVRGGGTVFVETNFTVHKQTNPLPEFRADFDAAKQPAADGKTAEVEPVTGLGDEAYTVYTDTDEKPMTLWVRDGWAVFEVNWEPMSNQVTKDTDINKDDKKNVLTAIATGTLPRLRK